MEIVLRVLQVFLAIGLIGVVLLQRSEGGGLGLGSSGGAGSFMSVRGSANFLSRATAVLAALFMITCLILALMAKPSQAPRSILDTPASTTSAPITTPAPVTTPAPAAEVPALPVPVPGEKPEAGVTLPSSSAPSPTTPSATAPATTEPAPAATPQAPAAAAPAKPEKAAPAKPAEKKATKTPQTGTAHKPGQ